MPFLAPAAPDVLNEILEQTLPLWGEGLGRDGYRRYNDAQRRTEWGTSHLQRLVLMDGRRWLATAKRYDLLARLDGRAVRVLGIGAVFTPPPLRGRGHAAELLRRMLDQAQGEGVGLALLFSEIGRHYYERLGFRSMPIAQVRLAIEPPAGRPGLPVRSGEARDVPALREMNEQRTAGFRFSLVRTEPYIAFALAKKRLLAACGPPGARKVHFFVVEEGSRAAAYAVVLEVGGHFMITECGDRDPSGARVGALLQAALVDPVRAADPSGSRNAIRAWLPRGFLPPQLSIVAHEVPPLTMMARRLGAPEVIDPPLAASEVAYWHADAF